MFSSTQPLPRSEERFRRALQDLFVGAPVEGESGFVNLMRVKATYFEKGVWPQLMADIEKALQSFPEFREELFDKLYAFFHRYFSESGSIYYRHTPLHERVYEKVYTDDRDVILFWKTHMLYYVKTDHLFRSMAVEVDGFRFYFDASAIEHKRANEKRTLIYEFKERRDDGTLVLAAAYSEGGRKTDVDTIRKAIRDALGLRRYTDAVPSEETIERAFRLFERQSEVDYFINKDARHFLREQFDLWLYQYVFEPEQQSATFWTEKRIRQIQVLKEIAYKLIDFIAQFEDELGRIWRKPKFAISSNYIITLGRIASRPGGMALLERLLRHPGMVRQLEEWRNLGMVSGDFGCDSLIETGLLGNKVNTRWQHLPVDTRYFKDLEPDILALFDFLDRELDGWLVKSENYQALCTMLPKFRERVSAIYIDPPYNRESGDEFLYHNEFRHASWLTMMENRLTLAFEFLTSKGVMCVAIDDFELRHLTKLLEAYPRARILGTVVVRSKPQGRATARGFSVNHDYAVFVSKFEEGQVGRLPRVGRRAARYREADELGIFTWANFRGTGANSTRNDRPKLFYPIYVKGDKIRIPNMTWNEEDSRWEPEVPPDPGEEVVFPIDEDGVERVWTLGWERAQKELHELKAEKSERGVQIYRKYRPNYEGALPGTWWDSPVYSATEHGTKLLQEMFGDDPFSYPKSVYTVMDSLRACNLGADGLVLDFFAGSGTTAHAVISLNREDGGRRKYVMVEMADYFDTVLLPRIKKAIFSDKWQNGKAREDGEGISHFVKYFQLEQYEDVLRRASYADANSLFVQDPYSQYVFLRDTKMLDNAATGEQVLILDTEREEVRVDLSRLYRDIDLPETLSCLTGKWIRRITREEVEFEDGARVSLTNPPWELVKSLIWW